MSPEDHIQRHTSGTPEMPATPGGIRGKSLHAHWRHLRLGMGRVWYSSLAVSLWLLIELMPEAVALKFASPLGRFLRRGTRDQIVDSMRRVLGPSYCRNGEWNGLWRSHSEHAALMIIEVIHLHRMPVADVYQRIALVAPSELPPGPP